MPHLDHFGLIAPVYDRILGGDAPKRLHELLALPAARLLDVGGGTGRVLTGMAGRVEQIVLCDASRGMLAASRSKGGLDRVQGLAEQLPFGDGAFDRVLVVDAFHHFADHPRAARELVRVLAPGGRLVIQDMNVARLPVKLIALGEKALLMGSRFYRPRELAALWEGTGVRVTVEGEGAVDLFVVVEKVD